MGFASSDNCNNNFWQKLRNFAICCMVLVDDLTLPIYFAVNLLQLKSS